MFSCCIHRRQEKSLQSDRESKFTKVVFREYPDSSFSSPNMRGEMEEHLGILGPIIKAEVGQSIMVRLAAPSCHKYNLNRHLLHTKSISLEITYSMISFCFEPLEFIDA